MANIIDFDAPHVVHLTTNQKIGFGEKSKGYHDGLQVVRTFPNFNQAAAYCKALNDRIPVKNVSWLIWHEEKIQREDGSMSHQTSETLMIPEGLTVDDVKNIFSQVLDVKYTPGSWRFQYWLG